MIVKFALYFIIFYVIQYFDGMDICVDLKSILAALKTATSSTRKDRTMLLKKLNVLTGYF